MAFDWLFRPILKGPPLLTRRFNLPNPLAARITVLPDPFAWKVRDPFTIKAPLGDWTFWYGFALFMVSLIPIFFWIVQPSLLGKNGLRIGADSAVYLWYSGLDSDSALLKSAYHVEQPYPDEITLVAFGGNYLGPYLIATTMKSNFMIMLFNYTLFFVALHYLFKLSGVQAKMLVTLLLINPITTVSIMTLNKEIIILVASALFAYYLESRSKFLLLIVLAVSMAARWEQTACVIIFLLLTSRVNPWRKRRAFIVFLVVLGITLIYPQVAPTINQVSATNEVGGNLMNALNSMQESYLFPLALIPKMLMNLFSIPISALYAKNWDWSDLQNSFIGPVSGVMFFVLICAIIAAKKLRLRKYLIYYSVLFMIALSASPIIQLRYMYPMYVFACIELSRKSVSSQ